MRRLVACLIALPLLVLVAHPAHAVGNTEAARKAATAVALASAATTDPDQAIGALIALAAVNEPTLGAQATRLAEQLAGPAATRAVSSPAAAAELAVAVLSAGGDPRRIAGLDLISIVRTGLAPDGTLGATFDVRSSALALIALTRADEPIPPRLLARLIAGANPDGGFPTVAGGASDAVATAYALTGLAAQSDSISATAAVKKAVVWATAQQQPDGSWVADGHHVTGVTALMGSAMQAAGQPQPTAVQYLVRQQLPDGSFGQPGTTEPVATQWAAVFLADRSLITAAAPGLVASFPTAAPSPTSSTSAPGTTQPIPLPGDASDPAALLWVLLPVLLLALLAGGFYLMIRDPSQRKSATAASDGASKGHQTPDSQP